jgi:hypothetical protein
MNHNNNNSQAEIPVASVVEDPVKRIQIPVGLRPGDSFIITEYGTPFTVIVPEGTASGSYINVIVPSEASVVDSESKKFEVDKSMAGAAIIGGTVGLVLFGPIVGVVLAGGAALAASQKDNDLGRGVRRAGKATFSGLEKAKKYVEKKVKCIDRS